MLTPAELEKKLRETSTPEMLFEVYKHQHGQLAKLSQLSYNLLVALDSGNPAYVRLAQERLSSYMLLQTNLAIDYCKDES